MSRVAEHKNIVKINGYCQEKLCIVMEFADCGTLYEVKVLLIHK
jgi:hypothetical protein